MSGIIESVAIILELLAILLCMSNTFGKKISLNVYLILLLIEHWVIIKGLNANNLPMYMMLLVYVAIFIYGLVCYKENIRITVINCFLSFTIVSILQLIFYIPIFFIGDISNMDSYIPLELYEVLINLLCVVTMIIFSNKVKLQTVSIFIQQKSWIMKILFISVMLYLFGNIFHMQMNHAINNNDFIQIIFFIILFFLALNEWQKAKLDAERKNTQLEMNRLYYDAYDELILLIRERQHDMKNHINAILGMIYTISDYDELVESQKRYCDDVIEKGEETKLLLTAENPLISGFLYRKLQEARKRNITVNYKVVSEEKEYFIPEYELIEMIGILFDNAVEALNENKEKKIYVKIEYWGKELRILVANISRYYEVSEISNFFQKDFTSKGKGRGIGLTKLKKMVQQNGGEIIVTNEKKDEENYLQFCIAMQKK